MNAVPQSFADWTPERKVAAVALLVVAVGLLTCAALVGAAAVFLVLHKVDPRSARLGSITSYWGRYSEDPIERRKLIASIAISVGGCFVIAPASLVAAIRSRRPLHGDARFATLSEVRRAGLLQGDDEDRSPRILVGRYRGRYLSQPGQLSVMLSAPTRSGKGVGVVIPNLLTWPDSVVVLDIKGENHAITAGYREECGQQVFAFSPFDEEGCSHRWNPLTAVRTDPLHRVGDLLAIGQVFFPNDGNGTSAEAFFNDQARNLFLGIGLYLLETPDVPRTIGEMLRQSSGKGRPMKDHFDQEIARRQSTGTSLSTECVDALQRLLTNSENTLTSIVATFNAPLIIFADAIVDCATSADDIRLDLLRRQRMSVYVRVPPSRLASARPLLNLFFSQLVSLNTTQLPERNPALRCQCLLVHDEFTSMGRVGVISSAAAFLAGYDLRLLTVVQAMSQLDAVYGDKEARTFATNHGMQVLFAPREQRDADEYSAMLGYFTERATSRGRSRSFSGHGHSTVSHTDSDQRRSLLLPQEIKEIGADRLVVVAENCKPILASKIRYHRDRAFRARLRPPPAVPRMAIDLHLAKVQQRTSYLPDEIGEDENLDVDRLAIDTSKVSELPQAAAQVDVERVVDAMLDSLTVSRGGGWIDSIEQSEEAEAGPASASVPPLDISALEQDA